MNFLLLTVFAAFTVEAVHFWCHFTNAGLPAIRNLYACNALVYPSESTFLVSVGGLHQKRDDVEYYTNDDVGCLLIRNQNLTFFPQEIDYFFKNLKIIVFSGVNLLSLSAQDLQPFPQLEHFGMNGYNLTSIDGDLFSFNKRLKSIDLDDNQIQHIGENLVTNLTLLQILRLSDNFCINKTATTRAEVLELAPQLSVLCPPLVVETTETPIGECPCDDEIAKLREENLQLRDENDQQNERIAEQNHKIEQLQQSNEKLFELNALVEQRLRGVDSKLREIFSKAGSYTF